MASSYPARPELTKISWDGRERLRTFSHISPYTYVRDSVLYTRDYLEYDIGRVRKTSTNPIMLFAADVSEVQVHLLDAMTGYIDAA